MITVQAPQPCSNANLSIWLIYADGFNVGGAIPGSFYDMDSGNALKQVSTKFPMGFIRTEPGSKHSERTCYHRAASGTITYGDKTTYLADGLGAYTYLPLGCTRLSSGIKLWSGNYVMSRPEAHLFTPGLFGSAPFFTNPGQPSSKMADFRVVGDDIVLRDWVSNYKYDWMQVTLPGAMSNIAFCERNNLDTFDYGYLRWYPIGSGYRTLDYRVYMVRIRLSDNIEITSPPLELMKTQISQALAGAVNSLTHCPDADHYSLVNECYDTLPFFESNGVAYLKELTEIKKLIPSPTVLLNLDSPKSWASLYLWAHYGLSLSIADTEELVEAFKKFIKSKPDVSQRCVRYATGFSNYLDSRGRLVTTRANVKVDFTPRDYAIEYIKGTLFDTNLTLTNLWDLIPFSFIADWFLDVSTVLESVDARMAQNAYYKLNVITYSLKSTATMDVSDFLPTAFGEIQIKVYNRWSSRSLPPFQLGWRAPTDPQKHWVEAAALIVANTN